jgi:chemosensory pili system protein ChpA (sensor histidine kinase/response regulator)
LPGAAATPGAAAASGDAAAAAAAAGDAAAAAAAAGDAAAAAAAAGDAAAHRALFVAPRVLSGREAFGSIAAGFEVIGQDTWNEVVVVFPVLLLTINALPRS